MYVNTGQFRVRATREKQEEGRSAGGKIERKLSEVNTGLCLEDTDARRHIELAYQFIMF